MQLVYATNLTLDREGDADVATVNAVIREWISQRTGTELGELGETIAVPTQQQIVSDKEYTVDIDTVADSDERPRFLQVRVSHPDDSVEDIHWITTFEVGWPGDCTMARVSLARHAVTARIQPARFEAHPPALVSKLIERFDCYDGIVPMLGGPTRIASHHDGAIDGLAAFANAQLEDRRLPIVVIASRIGDPTMKQVARSAARAICGAGHVFHLDGHLAAARFSEIMGDDQALFMGQARIYWPGWRQAELHNRWFNRDFIGRHRHALADALRRLVHPLAVVGASRPAFFSDVVRESHEARVAELRAKLSDASADEELTTLYDALTKEQATEIAQLKERVRDLQTDLENANAQLSWSTTQATQPEEQTRSDDPRGEVDDLLLDMSASKSIRVTESALDSWNDSTYPDPSKMKDALGRLHRAADAWSEAGGSVGRDLTSWLADEYGLHYSPHDEGLVQRGRDRFEFDGQEYSREPHIKLDEATSFDRVGRIYFAIDTSQFRWIVDHVGTKLYRTDKSWSQNEGSGSWDSKTASIVMATMERADDEAGMGDQRRVLGSGGAAAAGA